MEFFFFPFGQRFEPKTNKYEEKCRERNGYSGRRRGTLTSFISDFDEQRKKNLKEHLLISSHSHTQRPETLELNTSKLHSADSPHKYNWHLNIWKRRNRERERVRERRGGGGREIFSLYTKEFIHWQSNNTINECIIIPLDIHWWSRRDGKARLVRDIFSSLFNFSRKSFICFNCNQFFQHLLFHHHTLFNLLPQSHHLSRLSPSFFPNPFTFPREMKTSQWEWIGMWEWCVCLNVCVCVFKCVSMLYDMLISRWERGSLLCNLLTPTILPHLREPP